MAGKHRSSPDSATESRMIRLPSSRQVHRLLKQLADKELRSVGNMVDVLVREALTARGLLK